MAYVVTCICMFEGMVDVNTCLGITNKASDAFELIDNFDFKKVCVDKFIEGTKIIWKENAWNSISTDNIMGRAIYERCYNTAKESDLRGSATFMIYDVEGELKLAKI